MAKRILSPAVWLAAVGCAAAGGPPRDTVHVLAIGSGWEFAPTAEAPSVDRLPSEWRAVRLPHRLEADPCGLYRASFAAPAAWAALRVSLLVRTTGGTAWAWLNGSLVGVRSPSALDIRLEASKAIRAGAANTVLIGIAGSEEAEPCGLAACWLEATGPLGVERFVASPSCLAQGAVLDVALDAVNGTRERFEGKVEVALEWEGDGKQPARVWRRASDVRMEPGQPAGVAQAFEPDPARLWRPDDPFLYRLTATVQTRDGQPLRAVARRVGVRSVGASQGRWLANGEWVRFAGIAVSVRGATLVCTQPGQARAVAERRELPLEGLLDFCDEAGVIAFLDALSCSPDTPGWPETIAALGAEALRHPCVWGVVIGGDGEAFQATLARLREAAPQLPIGCTMPCDACQAKACDFLMSRFATKPVREDDDACGRRFDDLARDAAGKPVIVIDRLTAMGDKGRTDGSSAHRLREVERRSSIVVLAFELEPDDALFALVEKRLSPFRLNPPSHEARLDREQFVVKTRFEAHLASPIAQRLPCYSLVGYRIAWRACRGDTLVASGSTPLANAQPRAIEGGAQPGRGETEWWTDKPGDIEFAAELQTPAGRAIAHHSAKLSLKAQGGKAELSVQSLDSVVRNP